MPHGIDKPYAGLNVVDYDSYYERLMELDKLLVRLEDQSKLIEASLRDVESRLDAVGRHFQEMRNVL